MPGGTNSTAIIRGNCLRSKKWIKGASPSIPISRQKTQATDTKVTLISHDQLTSLKAQINPPATNPNKSYQQVLRGGDWGPPLSPPIWNTTSQTFNVDSQPKHQKEQTDVKNPPSGQEDAKPLAMGDSIFKTGDFVKISEKLGTQIKLVSAYASAYSKRSMDGFRHKNFEDLVPKELKKGNYSHLIMALPSVDITDQPGDDVNDPYLRQQVSTSSYKMVKTSESALRDFPNIKEVLLVERAPRHDKKAALSEFANQEIHRFLENSDYKDKIKTGQHSLDFSEEEERDSVYGTRQTHHNYDGYHLRGREGRNAMTNSLLNIFDMAGLNKKKQQDSAKCVQEESTQQTVGINYAASVNHFNPIRHVPSQEMYKKSKTVEVKIPKVQVTVKSVPKNVNKIRRSVKEIKANQDWPNNLQTKKLPCQISPVFGLLLTNRFQPNPVDMVPKDTQHTVHKKTETPTKKKQKKTKNNKKIKKKPSENRIFEAEQAQKTHV